MSNEQTVQVSFACYPQRIIACSQIQWREYPVSFQIYRIASRDLS